MKSRLLIGLTLVFGTSACQRQPDRDAGARAQAHVSSLPPVAEAASSASPGALPEDPEAGARSVAQWKLHLEREERERRLNYDRRRLPEHRQIVTLLRNTRTSYDRAAGERAVLAAEQRFHDALPKLESMLDHLDHWGASSRVLPDYKQLRTDFSEAYPKARIAALAGEQPPLDAIARQVDARFQRIEAWLNEAEDSEDE